VVSALVFEVSEGGVEDGAEDAGQSPGLVGVAKGVVCAGVAVFAKVAVERGDIERSIWDLLGASHCSELLCASTRIYFATLALLTPRAFF